MTSTPKIRTDDLRLELAGPSHDLELLVQNLQTVIPTEDQVWPIYACAEKTVAKLKLRLRVERPGIFQEIPTSKKPEQLLVLAAKRLKAGILNMDEGRLLESLELLRESRNHLRGYLAEKRKARLRQTRQVAVSSRSSRSPS